jgi:GTP-binding protein YchF
MGLKCGIVGLPNVGKSTLFNALTSAKALAANYPFATKEPNLGVITVPDKRLDKLAELVSPQKVLPTTVEILDIAGLIKGASKGEGLGNQFLANIREVDAILHVVRCFKDDNVVHVEGRIDPIGDRDTINTELMLKDLETIEKNIAKVEKKAKSGDKSDMKKYDVYKGVLGHVEAGNMARTFETDEEGKEIIKQMFLLTSKPVLYVCNVDENSVLTGNSYTQQFMESIQNENAEAILISAAIEADIIELEDWEERKMFLEEMGLEEPGVNRVIQSAYQLLDLITYFTAGEKEVRAWTIRKGTKAPGAAGVIHSDFEKGFIRAEVIHYEDFVKYGSEKSVKEAGKLSVEGKDYTIEDGDVLHFLFNV